jgi:hypothetical protein
MSQKSKRCIYCPNEDASLFRGVEHVIPKSFGTFYDSTPTLDCVCDECNRYFDRELDVVFARDTLEGIARYKRGQFSSEVRPQKRLNITLVEGAETGDFAGAVVSVDGTTGKLLPIAAQFLAFNFTTGKFDVFFSHQLVGLKLPEEIYGKPGKNGEQGTWKPKIIAPSKEEHDTVVDALQDAGIDFRPGAPFSNPFPENMEEAEQLTLPVAVVAEIDTLHKRAIAKILMNFVGFYLGREEVLKPRWDFLRHYVRYAQGEVKARISESPFWTGQETQVRRFADNSINVRAENLNGQIIGVIQFYNLLTYEMILVEDDSLPAHMEVAYRFTAGEAPTPGEKRRL